VLGQTLHESEQCAFEDERDREPPDRHRSLIRLGRLLVIDDSPQTVKHLLADQPGKESRDDADRLEDQLAHAVPLPADGET
jgi:hypothetical protein